MQRAPEENFIDTALSYSDSARSLPRSAAESSEAAANETSKSSERANEAPPRGSVSVQNGGESASPKNAMWLSDIADICPCIRTVAIALGSVQSEENFNRKALAVLYQSFKSETISADEAMFIHLVRFGGLEAAFMEALTPVLQIQRLLRNIASV